MHASGIYYIPNDVNARIGHAMIFGPEDTPYAHCPLMFNLQFPMDYPFVSPSVIFLTTDGVTRFHPNLYVNGKVCLSILGTWKGPSWAAVMTISTVLTSIQSLLEDNPIVGEPGWENLTLADAKAKEYADFVQMRLIFQTFRLLCRWKRGDMPVEWAGFEDVIEERGQQSYDALLRIIQEKAQHDEVAYKNIVYNMSGETNWKSLANLATTLQVAGA